MADTSRPSRPQGTRLQPPARRALREGHGRLAALLVTGALLAGCEAAVTVDLSTEAPSRREIQQVTVSVVGVEFRKSGGGTERLDFSDSTPFDLMDAVNGNLTRLFTDEELSDGAYTGLRLVFDEDEPAQVVNSVGGQFDLVFAAGDFAPVNFTVDKDDSSNESLVLTLDLRQSLTFDDGEYTLTPVLRSVRAEDGGQLTGNVTVTCPSGTSLTTGGAVYLYQGEDVAPDDVDRANVEPYTTTAVTSAAAGTIASYSLRFLPEGTYTLAATCRGDRDDPAENDELDFRGTDSVELDVAESRQLDLTN
jgi:hypothetical protein